MSTRPLPPAEPLPSPRTLALLTVGFLLVANPVYLAPAGDRTGERFVYEARQVETDPLYPHSEAVLNCNLVAVRSQDCAVTRRVLTEGPLRVDTDAEIDPSFTDYDYVSANGSLYRPTPRMDGETLVLALERADRERAAEVLATPYSDAPAAVRTAVDTGAVTTTTEIAGDVRFVRRNGTYYRVDFEGSVHARPAGPFGVSQAWLFALRVGGIVAGLALVWTAGKRAAA